MINIMIRKTFLFALIAAMCLPQCLVAKPRKKKVPVDSVAQMNYNGKHYVSIDNPETGKQEWVSNPDYVPLDNIRANRLFVRYERMMLNTPLVLCSPQSCLEI